MEQNKSHTNGFLIGVVVGVVLTLLFTTKKGKRILATLTDEGLNRFSDLEKAITNIREDTAQVAKEYVDEDLDEEMDAAPGEIIKAEHRKDDENGQPKKSHAGRRFFRGVTKKS